ncbi:low-density lipoprotein receptor-related protein 2-like [Copidosoma floridanum]|uniref:low-density lipoprotein receptor-related protein 2-like n=1 Tax=Copidosoma floridanum TaxID=29053 RepID=UPI0006C95C34|nr:low-density lipoprotein receptor-related protein 2-like [Copidosoma floridanum]
MKFKYGCIAVLVVVVVCEFGVPVDAEGCALKYKKHVEDKPNFLVITKNQPGLCRINSHEDNSTLNYHSDHKYADDIRPETVLGGLSLDHGAKTIIYWAKVANVDHSRFYRVELNDSHWERVLEQDDDFRDVAFDWISKNLYVIMGSSRNLMVAVNAGRPWYPAVILTERSRLTSHAVHPNRGYLFFAETSFWYGARSRIYRAHLDGTNIRELNRASSESRYYIASLLVDVYADRLYWCVPGLEKIQHSGLDGSEVRSIGAIKIYPGQLDPAARALAVDEDHVYYRAIDANAIRRVKKATGAKDPSFELVNDNEAAPITEILAYTQVAQKTRNDHPCRDDERGGCDKYCFAVPTENGTGLRRVCKCSFSEVLTADGVSCVKKGL